MSFLLLFFLLLFSLSSLGFHAPRNLDFDAIDLNSNGELDKKEIHALLDQDFQVGPAERERVGVFS